MGTFSTYHVSTVGFAARMLAVLSVIEIFIIWGDHGLFVSQRRLLPIGEVLKLRFFSNLRKDGLKGNARIYKPICCNFDAVPVWWWICVASQCIINALKWRINPCKWRVYWRVKGNPIVLYVHLAELNVVGFLAVAVYVNSEWPIASRSSRFGMKGILG